MTKVLWKPDPDLDTHAKQFINQVNQSQNLAITDFNSLYDWSIKDPQQFWNQVWDYTGIIAEHKGGTILEDAEKMPGAKWFPRARLNFAENLLRRRDCKPAILFTNERQQKTILTHSQLYEQVAALAAWFKKHGLQPGDRVAGFVPNLPESIVAMLATVSLGGVWSSCSPDFGVSGVLDRFTQIEPAFFISADAYYYNGKTHDCLSKTDLILNDLPCVRRTIIIPYVDKKYDQNLLADHVSVDFYKVIRQYSNSDLKFVAMSFNAPLYIMYSSGTTGVPKCIVHGIGGTLLQHLKEHQLHCNIHKDSRVFYFTTCGWMMWNWLVSALASEATIMLYEGSPFYPNDDVLFDFVSNDKINIMGVSAKYLDTVRKRGLEPNKKHNFSSLTQILSTGSPLVEESFDTVYNKIKSNVCLSSISGGTDIVSCFVLGSSELPVHRGELQTRGLGMKVEVWNEKGESIIDAKGELVCTQPFPSMPIGFWNDDDGSLYKKAYFSTFDHVWCHGDFVKLTANNGMIIYGRSDAVLNPGGVRIGTAEIYRQAESLFEVEESIVVGQRVEGDVRVILFVKLTNGMKLNSQLEDNIRNIIRKNATPRHVPAIILQAHDIPRTKSGKIVELAVQKAVHGEAITNKESLANPEVLDEYYDLAHQLTV